jgi:hypothetical protein
LLMNETPFWMLSDSSFFAFSSPALHSGIAGQHSHRISKTIGVSEIVVETAGSIQMRRSCDPVIRFLLQMWDPKK